MSINNIIAEKDNLLKHVEEIKSEVSKIEAEMAGISENQLNIIEAEIKIKQEELENVKKSSKYYDLLSRKKNLDMNIEKELHNSKMFIYKYLAQRILDKKKFYNKWSKLLVSDKEPLKYRIEGVTEGKEKEFLEFILTLDNATLISMLWTTGYCFQEFGPDYPTLEFLKIGEKYPQFGSEARFYFSISNYYFSTKIPEKDRDIYKRIDKFFR
jgi:hypothetical protein